MPAKARVAAKAVRREERSEIFFREVHYFGMVKPLAGRAKMW